MQWKTISSEFLLKASQSWLRTPPENAQQLAAAFASALILRTPELINVFKDVDRGKFSGGDYQDCPIPVGSGEVLTSPMTHALTLELLFPYMRTAGKILDLGCGLGYLTQCFGRLNPRARVLGVDIYVKIIEKARELSELGNLEFLACEAFEVLEEDFEAVNVGFAATEELFGTLKEKLCATGTLLCPVHRDGGVLWILYREQQENVIGDWAFSPMVRAEDLSESLGILENSIRELYRETEGKFGRKPNLQELPQEIHRLLTERRKVLSRMRKAA